MIIFQTFILYRTLSPGEILNVFIPDRVCAAIVGMNCNVLLHTFLVCCYNNSDHNYYDLLGDLLTKRSATISERASGSFSSVVCFCIFKKIEGEFSVAKTGHLPGDEIIIDAEIRNGGPRPIKSVQVCDYLFNCLSFYVSIKPDKLYRQD